MAGQTFNEHEDALLELMDFVNKKVSDSALQDKLKTTLRRAMRNAQWLINHGKWDEVEKYHKRSWSRS